MVRPGTAAAVDQVSPLLPSTHQAVPQAGGLVDALVAVPGIAMLYSPQLLGEICNLPVTLGYDGDSGLEAVCVIALVTPVT